MLARFFVFLRNRETRAAGSDGGEVMARRASAPAPASIRCSSHHGSCSTDQAAGSGGAALQRSDVVRLRHRIAYDFPSQGMAHPSSSPASLCLNATMFWGRNVTTKSSPPRLIVTCLRRFSEGLDDVK